MKDKAAILFSILSVLLPIAFVVVYLKIESEFTEAVAAGLLLGCLSGSVTGAALILNRTQKNILVTVLSILPIIPTVLFLMMWIPYYTFS